MKRALELSLNGYGYTNPNPLVGAVIVKDGKIIGEGYHAMYGEAHAEVNALRDAIATGNKDLIEGSTMYVTLEPCNHYGSTPPCVDEIIKFGISKVVVAMEDPNPIMSGKSIKKLRKHGIASEVGLLQEEAEKINEHFIKYITTEQPFVFMKTATSLDGKICSHTGDSKWITSEASREFVHWLRLGAAAIITGVNTVIKDDPELTARFDGLVKLSYRVIVDSKGRIPMDAKVLNDSYRSKTIVATTNQMPDNIYQTLIDNGIMVIRAEAKEGRVDLKDLMKKLNVFKVDKVMIEAGGELNYSFVEAGLVDKMYNFIAPKIIGGRDAKTNFEGQGVELVKDAIELEGVQTRTFGNDILIEGYIKK